MFVPSVVSAVVAGHVKVAADVLSDSWKLQVSRLVGEAEELITGQLGERIGSNDDETVPV
jgi:hypothetical protein